jgi:hypothetical protein
VKLGQGLVPKGADAARQAAAERQDRKARTLIILNVANQHLASINSKTTAKSLWDALENLYRAKSTARHQQLRRALAGLKKGSEESLTAYIARACGIRDALRATRHDVEEDVVVGTVLAGLPEAYRNS